MFWLLIGVVVGVVGDEVWGLIKRRFGHLQHQTKVRWFRRKTDAAAHARNLLAIYERNGLSTSLYALETVDGVVLPVLPIPDDRWTGRMDPEADSPICLSGTERVTFPFDAARIERMRQQGLKLWDGSILYSTNDGALGDKLSVGVCNYFAYVDVGATVLAESASISGKKPVLLSNLSSFENALSGLLTPVVLAAAATCVFETEDGPVVALQHRSEQVVNARGLVGVAPIFGLEPNVITGHRSKYGILTYNLMKELLEEFFNQKEARRAGDSPKVGDPDSLFDSPHGQRLVEELDSGRINLYVTGAAIDPSDGSLIISLLAHFTSKEYAAYVRRTATGSWESASGTGAPKIELRALHGEATDSLMSIDAMIASSIYSLDRARMMMLGRNAESN